MPGIRTHCLASFPITTVIRYTMCSILYKSAMSFIQLHPIYTLEVTNIINFVVMYIYFYFQIKNILIFHEWVFMFFSVYVIGIFSIFEICI